jgi:hypothetical protein
MYGNMTYHSKRAPVYTLARPADNYTVLPHMLQNRAPEAESEPHRLQNRPALTGTILTGTYRGAEQAQISAMNQPMTVHPKSRFTMKTPTESGLCRPTMVGRKYRKTERIRKVIVSRLSVPA